MVPRLVKFSCVYCIYVLNLKPSSEMQQKCFHAIVKVTNFSMFPGFPKGTSGRAAICSPSAVLKNRYFRPCILGLATNQKLDSMKACSPM